MCAWMSICLSRVAFLISLEGHRITPAAGRAREAVPRNRPATTHSCRLDKLASTGRCRPSEMSRHGATSTGLSDFHHIDEALAWRGPIGRGAQRVMAWRELVSSCGNKEEARPTTRSRGRRCARRRRIAVTDPCRSTLMVHPRTCVRSMRGGSENHRGAVDRPSEKVRKLLAVERGALQSHRFPVCGEPRGRQVFYFVGPEDKRHDRTDRTCGEGRPICDPDNARRLRLWRVAEEHRPSNRS